jgi:rhodanese-related sulfurtransferase
MMKKGFLSVFISVVILTFAVNTFGGSSLPEKKKTSLDLYANSQEAYAMWKASPEKVFILDVRTPHEYNFVGHPPMAYNFPSMFMSMEYDAKKKTYKMDANPNFVAEVQAQFRKDHTLLLICRSGGRSAKAVNLLAEAGFKNVYNVYDGFEGDKLKIEGSYFNGQRVVNGWKNSGNPWTYSGEKDLIYLSQ